MKKYFTSINISGNSYTGTVYDAYTNQAVYTSKSYLSQSQVVQEINNFLKTNTQLPEQTPTAKQEMKQPQTIQNNIKMQPTGPVRTGRCCGR